MYCSAPWTTVQIKNDGSFSYCCMSRDPLGKDFNDDRLVKGRIDMNAGKVLPVCQEKCFDIEHLFSSQREWLNKLYPLEHGTPDVANPEHVQYIDLRMGNICNFTCLMCGDRDSHIWGKINGKENPYISWARDPAQYDRIMNFIASCKNLRAISLAGGEPFYNKKQLFDLLDRLPRSLELKFITNVSYCDDEIISKLNEFKSGKLHCSIDGVGNWVETQRLRADWNLIETNVFKFAKELHDKWEVRLVPTFTVINTPGIPEFVDWYWNKLRPLRGDSAIFAYTICQMPERMTLYNIPLDQRQQIATTVRNAGYPVHGTIEKLLQAIEKDITPADWTKRDLKTYLDYVKDKTDLDVYTKIHHIGEMFNEE